MGDQIYHAGVTGTDPPRKKTGNENPLPIIPIFHERTHEGVAYIGGHLWDDSNRVADNGTADLLVVVPAGLVLHAEFAAAVGGESEFHFYDSTTVSGNGTATTIKNRAIYSSNTSSAAIYHTPTITDVGNAWPSHMIPGGGGPHSPGGINGEFSEFNLIAGNYLVRLINRSGQTQMMSIGVNFYERAAA